MRPAPEPRSGRVGEAFLAVSALATGALLVGARFRPVTSFAVLLLASVALGAVALVPSLRRGVRPLTVAVLALPVLALAVALPPRGSHDIWSYAMYGRMVARYHASPYRHIPAEYRHDPVYRLVGWRHTRSVYGPLFTALSAAFMAIAGASTLLARLAFQGIDAVALVAITFMLWRRGTAPVALALLVLNPVVVIGIVNGGHNDLLVGALVLAAVFRLQDRRPVASGAMLAAAGLIKVSVLLAAVAAVVWAWRRWDRRAVVAMAATIGSATAIAYAAVGGMAAVAPLHEAASRWSHASIWSLGSHWIPKLAVSSLSLFVIGAVVLAVGRRWHIDPSPSLVIGAFLLAYLLAAPYVMPWYVGWALPLLLIRPQSVLARVALVYAALLFVSYNFGSSGGLLGFPLRWSSLETQVFAIAAIVALAVWRRGSVPSLSHPSATMAGWTTTALPG